MAKQKGIIKLLGTLDDITFVKTRDGYLAKEKTSMAAGRIKSDPTFQRTRENNAEFGRACAAAKVLRRAFRSQLQLAKDGRVTSRLVKVMMKVVHADAVSTRGLRNVIDGETELLQGFQYNLDAGLGSTFFAQYSSSIDRASGETNINIPAYTPATAIVAPEGATHFKLVAAAAEVDFETGIFTTVAAESAMLPWNTAVVPASAMSNTLPAASVHPLFQVFGIQFFQVVNGTEYPLKNGIFNPLGIVNVSGV